MFVFICSTYRYTLCVCSLGFIKNTFDLFCECIFRKTDFRPLIIYLKTTYISWKIYYLSKKLLNVIASKLSKERKHRLLDLLIFSAGLIFFILNSVLTFNANSSIPPFLMITGLLLLLGGVLAFVFRKNQYFSLPNMQIMTYNESLFDLSERNKLVNIMTSKKYSELNSLKKSSQDSLKLRYYATKDGSLCVSQVIAYVNNEFANQNAVQLHEANDAAKFLAAIK